MSKWVRLAKSSSHNNFFTNHRAHWNTSKSSVSSLSGTESDESDALASKTRFYEHKVHYINLCPSDPIIGIIIEYYGGCGHVLTCEFKWNMNYPNAHKTRSLVDWVIENNIRVTITDPTILLEIVDKPMMETVARFGGLDNIEKLINYFLKISSVIGSNVFSNDILEDVISIINFIKSNNKNLPTHQYSHTVEDKVNSTSYSDLANSMFSNATKTLFNIMLSIAKRNGVTNQKAEIKGLELDKRDHQFTGSITDEEFKIFEGALKNGAYTNAVNGSGHFTMMMLAILTRNDIILKYMLIYHGNPILRHNNAEYHYSALDFAECGYYVDAVRMINYTLEPRPEPLFKVKYIDTSFDAGKVKTEIGFYRAKDQNRKLTNVVSTELKKSFSRNDPSAEAMIGLAKSTFDKTGKPTLDVEIDENLYKENQLTEIISDDQGIIGFSLFEIIQTNDPSKIIFYCNISQIAEQYSKHGIMSLLIWRHAYALQLLHPEKTVCVFYIAVSAFSYRLVQNYLHWPMYQPVHIASEIPNLYKAIKLRDNHKNSQSITLCENQIHVIRQPKSDFYNDFFYRHLLKQPNNSSTGSKGIPVLYFVSGDTYNALKSHCHGLGISDIGDHLFRLADNLYKLLSDKNTRLPQLTASAQPKFYTYDANFRFWTGKTAPTDMTRTITPSKLRSKL